MKPVDRTILEFCGADFRGVASLKPQIPSGTLYRHVGRLVRLGWLEKAGTLYRTTAAGHRQLHRPPGGHPWDVLERLYPPLGLVPTPVHRALAELIFAAVVARAHPARTDRHPFFVAFGSTLHWKTSLGRFICHALGLEPTMHVVDCGTETGKSLAWRRNASGDTISKRKLLDSPFVVLDEFLTADPSVRSTLNLFLSGRLVVPVENEQLTLKPVPLLTLNPKAKDTLEGRVGLSAPLIRRGIFADLDAVVMPDLVSYGEAAVEAARHHAPLVVEKPRADCHEHHDAIVALARSILTPEARERVDVEIVVSLSTGMTAFIPDPTGAIATVMHAIGMTAETLGWTQVGWIETVANFTLSPTVQAVGEPDPRVTTGGIAPPESEEARRPPSPVIRLAPERPAPPRRGSMPSLDLGEAIIRRLIWLAEETQQSVEEAITVLLELYLERRANEVTFDTLATIVRLAESLDMTTLDVVAVEGYLRARRALAKRNCSFDDVPEALAVLELLEELPLAWDWKAARAAMALITTVLSADISLDEVGAFLGRHRRFVELGVDERAAEAIATCLLELHVTEGQRPAIMQHIITAAATRADLAALEQEHHTLQAAIDESRTTTAALDTRQQELRDDIESLEQYRDTLRKQAARLEVECARMETDLAVARGLRNLLLNKTPDVEVFFVHLAKLQQWRRSGGSPNDAYGRGVVSDLRSKVIEFVQQLLTEGNET